MKYKKSIVSVCAAIGLLVLILDAKATAMYAYEGVVLCLRTLIPSLFPFFVLSVLLNQSLLGQNLPGLKTLGRICGLPQGCESILLLGLLGGYPVGASSIYECYSDHAISKQTAHRLLGFCNNAGPAFIFGMAGTLFSNPLIPWFLWGIHMLSAIFVGIILPHKDNSRCAIAGVPAITLSDALKKSIPIMAGICGWVILFRVIIGFCSRWFMWLLPIEAKSLMIGVLELSNGCAELKAIPSEAVRFMLCAGMLAFGGLCVGMQTITAAADLGTGLYFPGKLMQVCFSVILAYISQRFLFDKQAVVQFPVYFLLVFLLIFGVVFLYILTRKKEIAFA